MTGRIESGIVKVGDEVDIVGIMSPQKSIVTGALAVDAHAPHAPCTGAAAVLNTCSCMFKRHMQSL